MSGDAIVKYFQAEAYGSMELDRVEGGPTFRTLLDRVPTDGSFSISSASWTRANAFDVVRYNFALRGHYTVTTFRLGTRSTVPGAPPNESIFGIAYWLTAEDAQAEGSSDPAPDYVCVGGTYVSQDGEYRDNFIAWSSFCRVYEEALGSEDDKLVSLLEEDILKLIGDGEISVEMYVHPYEELERLEGAADNLRISLKLLVAAIAIFSSQTRAVHFMPTYKETMRPLIDYVGTNIDPKSYTLQCLCMGVKQGKSESRRRTSCGQKLIPMMRAAVVQFGNIRYPTAREVWVSETLSDFKLNGRSNAFPLMSNWSTVHGISPTMFDNDSMTRMMRTSRVVGSALEKLQHARAEVLAAAESGKRHQLEGLDHKMYQSVVFAEQHMLLSDVALLLVNEFVGITVGSLKKAPAGMFAARYSGRTLYSTLFEIAFGCYTMHEVCIHSDLHYHNMTVQYLWNADIFKKFKGVAVEKACYVFLGGPTQEDAYVLPVYGVCGRVIDFSRALVSPRQREAIVKHQGEEQTTVFYVEQAERMIKALERWEPAFVAKHEEKLRGAAYASPQHLYDVLVAIDFLAVGRNFGAMLDELAVESPADAKAVSPDVREACAALQKAAHAELLRGLQKVVLRRGDPDGDARATGRRVLADAFGAWKFTSWDPGDLDLYEVVDVFRADAPLRYSGGRLDRFPPWADIPRLADLSGRSESDIMAPGTAPLFDSMESRTHGELDHPDLELLVERERTRLLRAPPPDAGTSWVL